MLLKLQKLTFFVAGPSSVKLSGWSPGGNSCLGELLAEGECMVTLGIRLDMLFAACLAVRGRSSFLIIHALS